MFVFLTVSLCVGELSEQQKLELESHKALVVDQKIQLRHAHTEANHDVTTSATER